MEDRSLEKSRNGLSKTGKPSSQDLVLARMLDLAAQVMRQEVMPGEVRFWSETFSKENPEMLEWAFREYLRGAEFFPKPSQIAALIERKRAAMVPHHTKPLPSREETDREQATPEWEEWSKKARETLARIAGKTVIP